MYNSVSKAGLYIYEGKNMLSIKGKRLNRCGISFSRFTVAVSVLSSALFAFTSSLTAEDFKVNVDLKTKGRIFDGIGMLSAGASSRLLIDYPEPQRSQILDYLFKPKFGASLHILKVEIGGDVNSTDGSEPCHARSREEMENPRREYFERGYENWLMREAKKRNPDIKLAVLQWGAPAWVAGDNFIPSKETNPKGFYTQANADLILSYIKGVKKYYNLDIDYCGIWNERMWNCDWIKLLRRTLDKNGLQKVKIIAADIPTANRWDIVTDALKDKELMNAIGIFGVHYPKAQSTKEARACGKTLWNSEGGPWSGTWAGAKGLLRRINRCYIQGKMTGYIKWSLISSYYPYLMLPDSGMMLAETPWSGHYEVQPQVWAVAHITQFSSPGWNYVDSSSILLDKAGSIVTLLSPDQKNISFIIETSDTKKPINLKIKLPPEFASADFTGRLTVYDKFMFERMSDIKLENGILKVTIPGSSICTVSTVKDHHKGTFKETIPSDTKLPLPYVEDFETGKIGFAPKYFSDQNGAFEVAERADGKGKCLKQVITRPGIFWHKVRYPVSVTGPANLGKDYKVSLDFKIPDKGFALLAGRVYFFHIPFRFGGIALQVNSDGSWVVSESSFTKKGRKKTFNTTKLKTGKAELKPDWNTFSLVFKGTLVTAFLNGKELTSAQCVDKPGAVGIACDYNHTCFDNLKVTAE